MNIRRATLDDISPLIELWKTTHQKAFAVSYSAEEYESYVKKTATEENFKSILENDTVLVADEQGAVVGFVQFGAVKKLAAPDAGSRELRRLYISPDRQGKGIGSALLQRAIEDMKDVKRIYLDVWEHNAGAQRLYESHGFKAIGEQRSILPSGQKGQGDIIMLLDRTSG